MEKKTYETPVLRVVPLQYLEPFCASGGAPDYDPLDGFEWGDD